jgi:hypothetical protein
VEFCCTSGVLSRGEKSRNRGIACEKAFMLLVMYIIAPAESKSTQAVGKRRRRQETKPQVTQHTQAAHTTGKMPAVAGAASSRQGAMAIPPPPGSPCSSSCCVWQPSPSPRHFQLLGSTEDLRGGGQLPAVSADW